MKGLLALLLALLDTCSLPARFAAVGSDLRPGRPQRLGVAHQPVKAVEAITLLLFGFRTQLRSPVPEFRGQYRFPHGQLYARFFCRRRFIHSPISSRTL